ncbi:hypothetical protein JXD20_00375 [Candidatus Peregrinibacteria bacterium]|nr:hypothetical protein [Candidatus Peregrinibacteria bacterium]
MADALQGNIAHADDQDLSVLDNPENPPAESADDTDGLDASVTDESAGAPEAVDELDAGINESAGAAETVAQGEVYLFLNECHAEGELDIHSEAADPAEREPIPYRMEAEGHAAVISCELGRATRFCVNSTREGTLHCELRTTFERVGVRLDFTQESVYFEPVTEGEGL